LLKFIRNHFNEKTIDIRVDANGAFSPNEAMEKLNRLADYKLHSIEQPIAQHQLEQMTKLCQSTPIPIALDEELIGVFTLDAKKQLLQKVQPHYIILKPSLVGGFKGTKEWIDVAESMGIQWWITSALESNIGLNAIAQWTFLQNNSMPQGLGTGGLYTNNFDFPLLVQRGELKYNVQQSWNTNQLSSFN
jgi:L-alanine-DL-glutamate epimerase-like enolase superfamily enzyme